MPQSWRLLPWLYRWEEAMEQNTGVDSEEYAPVEFPDDSDERIPVVLNISLNEFVAVLSALDKGATLSYGDQAFAVVWYFLRNFEMPISLCDQIAACIAENAGTQEALRNFITGDTEINQHIQEVATAGQPMTGPQIEALIGDECDEDAAFGGWSALIRQMDANNRDLFDRIEVGTNAIERTNLTISALPGIGLLPIDELFGFFDELLDNLVENYAAQYTTTVEDELRCGLFCLAMDNDCGLNFDQVFTYFNDRLSASFTTESLLLDILSFIGAGSWSGTQIVDAMMLLQVAILRTSSTFIDFPVYSLQTTYTLGLNDPDPDWSTLCDCGPLEWEKTFDFTASTDTWTAVLATYVSSVGFQNTGSGGFPYTCDISKAITWGSAELTRIRVGATSTAGDAGAFRGVYYPGTAHPAQTGYETATGDYEMDFTANNPQPPTLEVQVSNNTVPGSNTIRYVTLNGTGPEPSW